MCRVLNVSPQGYYQWLKRSASPRSIRGQNLDIKIRRKFIAHDQKAGSPKITNELRQEGEIIHRSRVAARMKAMGLHSKVRKKYRATTDSKHSEPVCKNLLNRNFSVSAPNTVWVSDITYLRTLQGWAYLVVFIDLYSRKVVGWSLSDSLSHHFVCKALWQAINRRRPEKGLMIHSDRGVQYACEEFRKVINQFGIIQSMSRKGNCWDNAVAESFFKTLKVEWYYGKPVVSFDKTYQELFEYLERYYNCKRLHATLNYLSPNNFEITNKQKIA